MVHRVFNFQLFVLKITIPVRIIAYVLLCGYTPFRSDDIKALVNETAAGKIEFHERYWKNVSAEGSVFQYVIDFHHFA